MIGTVYKAIGLMSGTSLDGEIDVALIETDGQSQVKALDFYAHRISSDSRDLVRSCFGKTQADEDTKAAEIWVTDMHIEAVQKSGFSADIIGFHGQTITHDPPSRALRRDKPAKGMSWQLGDGARLARETGMAVVGDFRSADVRAGGQGAPLAPVYHAALMVDMTKPLAVLNLGGVGNMTFIGVDGALIAFDTGPANALMDDAMRRFKAQDFDKNGALAAAGQVDEAAVAAFLQHPYFAASPPKSLDRNAFEAGLPSLPDDPADAMATLAAMSVAAIKQATTHLPALPRGWYVCGGGRRNDHIMRLLAGSLAPADVNPIEAAGYNGDAIEAECFAYLAVRSLLGLPLSLPSTTGVDSPQTGGVYHKP